MVPFVDIDISTTQYDKKLWISYHILVVICVLFSIFWLIVPDFPVERQTIKRRNEINCCMQKLFCLLATHIMGNEHDKGFLTKETNLNEQKM